jgi:hypothetical protein
MAVVSTSEQVEEVGLEVIGAAENLVGLDGEVEMTGTSVAAVSH